MCSDDDRWRIDVAWDGTQWLLWERNFDRDDDQRWVLAGGFDTVQEACDHAESQP
jgi:hypothetical protein